MAPPQKKVLALGATIGDSMVLGDLATVIQYYMHCIKQMKKLHKHMRNIFQYLSMLGCDIS